MERELSKVNELRELLIQAYAERDAAADRAAEAESELALWRDQNPSLRDHVDRVKRRAERMEAALRGVATFAIGADGEEDALECWCPAEYGENSGLPHTDACLKARAALRERDGGEGV